VMEIKSTYTVVIMIDYTCLLQLGKILCGMSMEVVCMLKELELRLETHG
jgi:hypothetical protein